MKAAWTRSGLSGVPRPSMVVIAWPAAPLIGVVHDRTAAPSSSTVHAPHWPRPHPNFGPCSASAPRRTYSSGCAGSHESADDGCPLSRKRYVIRVRRSVYSRSIDAETMSGKVTLPALQRMKEDRQKIVGIVVYDCQMAQIADRAGVEIVS